MKRSVFTLPSVSSRRPVFASEGLQVPWPLSGEKSDPHRSVALLSRPGERAISERGDGERPAKATAQVSTAACPVGLSIGSARPCPAGAERPETEALSWEWIRCWAFFRPATNPRRWRTAPRNSSTADSSACRRPASLAGQIRQRRAVAGPAACALPWFPMVRTSGSRPGAVARARQPTHGAGSRSPQSRSLARRDGPRASAQALRFPNAPLAMRPAPRAGHPTRHRPEAQHHRCRPSANARPLTIDDESRIRLVTPAAKAFNLSGTHATKVRRSVRPSGWAVSHFKGS